MNTNVARRISSITEPGWEIRDAIIIKSKGHESEPVIRINREASFEMGNLVLLPNPLYSYDPLMQAMNVIRKHLERNPEKYKRFVAEFAGIEKVWSSAIELSSIGQYGMSLKDVIIFPRYSYDTRNLLQPLSVARFDIENCIILNEGRITEMPPSGQKMICFIREQEEKLPLQQG